MFYPADNLSNVSPALPPPTVGVLPRHTVQQTGKDRIIENSVIPAAPIGIVQDNNILKIAM